MRGIDKYSPVVLGLAMLLIGLAAGASGAPSRLPTGLWQALKLITENPAEAQHFSVCRLSAAQSE